MGVNLTYYVGCITAATAATAQGYKYQTLNPTCRTLSLITDVYNCTPWQDLGHRTNTSGITPLLSRRRLQQ